MARRLRGPADRTYRVRCAKRCSSALVRASTLPQGIVSRDMGMLAAVEGVGEPREPRAEARRDDCTIRVVMPHGDELAILASWGGG